MNKNTFVIVLTLIFCLFINLFHLKHNSPEYFYNDDALFYIIIATNYLENGEFTFDKESKTNGFHWGGMIPTILICIFLNLFLNHQTSFYEYFKTFSVVYSICIAALIYLLWKNSINKHLFNQKTILRIIISFGITFFLSLSMFPALGMETIYLPILLGILTDRIERKRETPLLMYLILLIGVLIRIDYIGILLFYLVWFRVRNSISKKEIICGLAGMLSGLIIVFILNDVIADSMLSTSLIIKAHGINIIKLIELLFTKKFIYFLIIYLSLLILSLNVSFDKTIRNKCIDYSLLAILVYLQVNIQRALWGGNLGSWYDVPHYSFGIIVVILVIINAINANKSNIYKKISIISIGTIIVLILIPTKTSINRFYFKETERFNDIKTICIKIDKETEKNVRIAIDDLPGIFRIYLDRNIISLDGLVNSSEYINKYLKKAKISEYLKEKQIEYLIISNKMTKCINNSYVGEVGFLFNENMPRSKIKFKDNQIVMNEKVGNNRMMLIKLK